MRCAWESFLSLIPTWMRYSVDKQTKDVLQELRLRLDKPPEMVTQRGSIWLDRCVTIDDLNHCINTASRYSPWAAATSARGFITAPGGHRIGICGEAVVVNERMTGIRVATSLCIRIARDFPGSATGTREIKGSILIIGRPGSGKTTLLRDLIRQISDSDSGSISVIDEKEELFPRTSTGYCFPIGKHTDVLSGCKKNHGIQIVLQNMGPRTIAVDEITAREDCEALIHAGWCGVRLLATAHASNLRDLYSRDVYRPIVESKLFNSLIVMQPDKSWRFERMCA